MSGEDGEGPNGGPHAVLCARLLFVVLVEAQDRPRVTHKLMNSAYEIGSHNETDNHQSRHRRLLS